MAGCTIFFVAQLMRPYFPFYFHFAFWFLDGIIEFSLYWLNFNRFVYIDSMSVLCGKKATLKCERAKGKWEKSRKNCSVLQCRMATACKWYTCNRIWQRKTIDYHPEHCANLLTEKQFKCCFTYIYTYVFQPIPAIRYI